jgi:TRAP-type uncharacterized transport system substrate-binding protein
MAAILTRIERCKTLFVEVALLGVCLVSMACTYNGPPLPPIDRDSFMPCKEVPTDEHVQYLATATASGTYVLLGDAIEKITRGNREIQLRVCTTDGSNDNLTLLRKSKVQFALVQLDTLHYAIESELRSKDDIESELRSEDHNIRLVTFLYSEKLHLFIRPHLYLNSPSELTRAGNTTDGGYKAKTWLGPNGSGGRDTASRVLEAAGISADDIDSFATTRIDRLTEDGLYVRTSIDLGNYRYLKRGVPTVGIPTVLLTNLPEDDRDTVEALISDIEHNNRLLARSE